MVFITVIVVQICDCECQKLKGSEQIQLRGIFTCKNLVRRCCLMKSTTVSSIHFSSAQPHASCCSSNSGDKRRFLVNGGEALCCSCQKGDKRRFLARAGAASCLGASLSLVAGRKMARRCDNKSSKLLQVQWKNVRNIYDLMTKGRRTFNNTKGTL